MASNLLSVWGTIGSVLLAILILLVMITIHEFGHYLAGKIFHFTINEFSIGFGPALFKHTNKKTGELFAVRLIPLGGYCAFEGEDGLDEEEEKKPEEAPVSPFSDLDGEMAEAPVQSADGAAEGEPEPSEKKQPDPNSFTKKPCWQRIIVLIAGALMNYLLALLLIMIGIFAYGQNMVLVTGVDSPEDGMAKLYSFQEGDILLRADGKSLYLTTDIARAVNGKKAGESVTFLVAQKREDGSFTEPEERVIVLREDVNVKNSGDNRFLHAIGIGVGEPDENGNRYYELTDISYRFGFWEAIGRSFVYSFKIAGSIFRVLGELLTGKLGLSAFGGPVTTVTMTSQIVSRGFRYFLEIAGYIGVNLAVFNLLPIPALDGSKVVFTAIEWVRGKPISRKVEAIIHAVGFVLLLGFAILVDILQFV